MNVERTFQFITLLFVSTSTHLACGQTTEARRFLETGYGDAALVVAPVEGANEFHVYSSEIGHWSNVAFPDGVTVNPILGRGVCAFRLDGENIMEIVAVDRHGRRRALKLPKPATKCIPAVSNKIAVFFVDGRAHAFSGETGQWDSIDSPTMPQILENETALIVADDWIGAFSSKSGKWSVAQTKK